MEHQSYSAVSPATSPEGPKIPEEYPALVTACSDGDLAAVERLVTTYLERTPEEIDLDILGSLPYSNLWGDQPSVPLVSYLVSKGAPVQASAFIQATKLKSYELLQLFLDHGFDINKPHGSTPPALAAAVEDEELTRWFLAHGADPNAECEFWDRTPLSDAVVIAPMAVVKLLFEHGGSAEHGQLLHEAVWRPSPDIIEVVTMILDRGAAIDDVMYQNRPEIYAVQFAASLGTALHIAAAERGNLELVELLLQRGADPLVRDANCRTPLERAQQHEDRPGLRAVMDRLRPVSVPPAEPRRYFTDDVNLPRENARWEEMKREQGLTDYHFSDLMWNATS